MPGKKLLLAKLLHNTRLCKALNSPKRLHVLCYHRVAQDMGTIEKCHYDSGVYGCTAQEFDRHLRWLKQNTTVLDLDGLLALAKGEFEEPGPYSMVTFDDAYRDVYTVAYPLLKKRRVPGIVFVPTSLISQGLLGWWDLIAYVFKNAKQQSFQWKGREFQPRQNFGATLRFFLNTIKLEHNLDIPRLIDELARLCSTNMPSPEDQAAELMTWDHLREMSEDWVESGSHTHSHRVLATLEPEEQLEELGVSKAILEKEIHKPCRALAFPVGGGQRFNQHSKTAARQCGYQAAFSFGTGCNQVDSLDLFKVCRFEPGRDIALLTSQCSLPKLMHG